MVGGEDHVTQPSAGDELVCDSGGAAGGEVGVRKEGEAGREGVDAFSPDYDDGSCGKEDGREEGEEGDEVKVEDVAGVGV